MPCARFDSVLIDPQCERSTCIDNPALHIKSYLVLFPLLLGLNQPNHVYTSCLGAWLLPLSGHSTWATLNWTLLSLKVSRFRSLANQSGAMTYEMSSAARTGNRSDFDSRLWIVSLGATSTNRRSITRSVSSELLLEGIHQHYYASPPAFINQQRSRQARTTE
jgi:hypothetical protein